MEYSGHDRRQTSPDTLLILAKIQDIAVSSARTDENVQMLRAEFAESKASFASCPSLDDLDRVEKKIDEHIEMSKKAHATKDENRKWKIATAVAIALGLGQAVPGIMTMFAKKGHP